ncbi:GntR family transcriptional regulator [Microvirga pudoricolor]|uniref:GntR family transcriptional regulator n=1 Tax=Microvirga pudoricolor TaxID=2778729 RepID=UPI0019514B38|nr:GntR family transcriptional regulator [Microvirga pudoricolor]MBM6593157.1 GntR family transcriptional regulator [Microvirga pudoricolor]
MARPSLSLQMTARIIEHIRENNLSAGQHLPAQTLADALRVSRAPIAAALKHLEELEIVRLEPYRGYFLAKDARDLAPDSGAGLLDPEPEDDLYFRIAEDRLSGGLPDRVTENELMRLYAVARSRLLKVLHRISEEGWVERLPGNGWAFRAGLTSREGYEQAYQFRAAIESQALLLQTFRIDGRGFRAARAEQQAILDGGYERMSRNHLFQANSQFHEMLIACAHNDFFLDAVRRVNRLRRLIEYRVTVDRSRLPVQSREHLQILDLIEAGQRQEASDFLRTHILGASAIKSPQLG